MRYVTTFSLLSAVILCAALPASDRLAPRAGTRSKDNFEVTQDFPGVPFKIPQSWAGLLPISDKQDESRELFFWYYPPTIDTASDDDLMVWLNGGPGCSSLEGALEENGPWLLPFNSTDLSQIKENPYSFTNLSHVVYIEQPVGTGFTEGEPHLENQEQTAQEFLGFFEQFLATFPELQNKKLWLTGESYAGKYIPYMASAMYNDDEASSKGINLQGFHIFDPSFTLATRGFGQDLPAVDYAIENQETLGLNDSFMADLIEVAKENGLYEFTERNLKFPPEGHVYAPEEFSADFQPWATVYYYTNLTNPCFDVYQIEYKCPVPADPLGFSPVSQVSSRHNYLNDQKGVKAALHVPEDTVWHLCSPDDVYPNGDKSAPPDVTVLADVIEKSERSMITHGVLDFVLLHQGTLLAINNLTWAGELGFQEEPTGKFMVQGEEAGLTHTERGLTWTQVERSGHMVPQDYPEAAYLLMQYLMGQADSLE